MSNIKLICAALIVMAVIGLNAGTALAQDPQPPLFQSPLPTPQPTMPPTPLPEPSLMPQPTVQPTPLPESTPVPIYPPTNPAPTPVLPRQPIGQKPVISPNWFWEDYVEYLDATGYTQVWNGPVNCLSAKLVIDGQTYYGTVRRQLLHHCVASFRHVPALKWGELTIKTAGGLFNGVQYKGNVWIPKAAIGQYVFLGYYFMK